MATTIRLKNSVVKGKKPLPSGLQIGEVAIGAHSDTPALYFKDNLDNIIELKPGASVGNGESPPEAGNDVGDLWWNGGELLIWNGTTWLPVGGVQSVNSQTGVVVLNLADINDVSFGPPSEGDLIAWDGTAWVNATAAADSEKLNGQEPAYYLNYENATNTPDLNALDYVPMGSWSGIPELV